MCCMFFLKQKTAYELRISDWSSDVCSSDLERLAGWLAQDRVLWLNHGYLEGDDTDAHIDTLARFAPHDAIVFQACDAPADSHHAELQAMADEIAALRTRDGRPSRLSPLPWPRPIEDDGRRLAASSAHFQVLQGAVLLDRKSTRLNS